MTFHVESEQVTRVLLADGWHEIVPGSFRIESAEVILRQPGDPTDVYEIWSGWDQAYSFDETGDDGSPQTLLGPMSAVLGLRTY